MTRRSRPLSSGWTKRRQFARRSTAPDAGRAVSIERDTKGELRKRMKDHVSAISEVLQRSKVRLGLEFLGPLHFRKQSPHEFIWRMNETLEFAKECGPNIGLCLDAWHWHHTGASAADIVAAGKSRIVTIHVSDAKRRLPKRCATISGFCPAKA